MKKSLLFVLALLVSSMVYAQSYTEVKNTENFEKALKKQTQTTETLQSDFTQIKHLDILEEDIESEGQITSKGRNLRWEYTEPIEYLMVMNNGKISIKDDGNVNTFDLSGNKSFEKINDMIVESMEGGGVMDNEDYKYKLYESKKLYRVDLFPQDKKTKEFMKMIQVHFDKDSYLVESVKLLEQSGDYTKITFKNRKVNVPVSDKLFTVK